MSRLSTLAVSTLVPALNVLSTTLPDSTALSLVRTKAGPLPGLTCWNSTTDQSWPSMLSTRPFFRSLVVATRKSLSSYGLTGRRRQRADLPVEVCRGSLSMVAGGGRPPRTRRPPPVVVTTYGVGPPAPGSGRMRHWSATSASLPTVGLSPPTGAHHERQPSLLALLEAEPGKGDELAAFLEQVAPSTAHGAGHRRLVRRPGQRADLRIFDAVADEERAAGAPGRGIPAAARPVGPDLVSPRTPTSAPVDVIAPRSRRATSPLGPGRGAVRPACLQRLGRRWRRRRRRRPGRGRCLRP